MESALEAGYRHIDGAAGYNNEAGVGRALNNAGFTEGEQRKNLWLRRNCAIPSRGMTAHARRSTASLACCSSIMSTCTCCIGPTPFDWRSGETWKAFQEFRAEGRVRTLGVCNFLPEHLDRLHEETGEYPAVNQIELHPTWQQREVVDYCKAHGIAVEAYSPMARGADLNAGNGAIERIAAEHGVTPAQVILRWHIENGTIIIPKSVHADRQKQNLDLFGFVLTPEEHAAIDALDGPTRAGHDPMTFTYA